MFPAESVEMSYQMRIDKKSRKVARFISGLQRAIQSEFIASGKTQQEVADALGVGRSVINRRLKGSANLTARSIAEFAYALDKDVKVVFTDVDTRRNSTETHADMVISLPPSGASVTVGSVAPGKKYTLENSEA